MGVTLEGVTLPKKLWRYKLPGDYVVKYFCIHTRAINESHNCHI